MDFVLFLIVGFAPSQWVLPVTQVTVPVFRHENVKCELRLEAVGDDT